MVECKVSRVKIDRQGYTPEGRYFGVGAPVFRVEAWTEVNDWDKEEFVREPNYQTARNNCKAKGWKVMP